jgi:isoquinoline 1-oxidoreductase beta subunit
MRELQFSRRELFAAGSLVLTVALPACARGELLAPNEEAKRTAPALNAFIAVAPDGQITFVAPSAEIGQGIFTAEAQIVAEELDCDIARMRIVAAPADVRYANPILRQQLTVGSFSTRGFFKPLRIAGAQVRMRLVAAAARQWSVPVETCKTESGVVVHTASGRRLGYGDLAEAAGREPIPAPENVPLKPSSDFKYIGRSVPRIDVQSKANGRAIFGIDMVRPGMKYAAVDSCPIVGGRLDSVDPSPALAVRGVQMVIPLPNAVAVLADDSWTAMKALSALRPNWTGDRTLDDACLARELVDAARGDPRTFHQTVGDPHAAGVSADRVLDMVFEQPFLAHAPMEPLNATVELSPDGCDIWVGTQAPQRVQAEAAKVTGLPLEKVRVWNQLSGGGFGRRAGADYIPAAVMIAQKAGVPVKMVWTREQDMRACTLRPLWRHEVSVALKGQRITAWRHRIVGGSVVAQQMPQLLKMGPDSYAVEGALELIYDVGSTHLEYVRRDPPLPITFWRSVGPGHNMFVVEGAVNEAAEAAGVDPVAFRRTMIKDERARCALDLAVEKSGWGELKQPRVGRGVALQHAFGGYLACVLEAEVDPQGDIDVRRITVAVDIGQVINPDGARSQIEGGLIYGLSAALWGEVNIRNGQIVQTNFNSYRVLRINETPRIDLHMIESDQPPQGLGEAGTSIVFPALAAAYHDATGVRPRSLPLSRLAARITSSGNDRSEDNVISWPSPERDASSGERRP